MTPEELEAQLQSRADQLTRLGVEADRQLVDVARRRDNASTRAALVVSSAAIASGVQLSKTTNGWMIASVIAALVAAGLAVPLLGFSDKIEVKVRALLLQIGTWSPRRLELEILNVKNDLIDQQEKSLVWRSRLLLSSLIALAVAIAFTVVELFS
jgi:hypothetical protein